jgi:hypothetical protein
VGPLGATLNLTEALTSTVPDFDSDTTTTQMDLGNTLPSPGTAIGMHVNTLTDMSSPF